MLKKILSLISAICLIFSMIPGVVFADSLETTEVYSDETVSPSEDGGVVVPIYISGNPGLMGFVLNINYDAQILSPVSVTAGDVLTAGRLDDDIEGTTSLPGEFHVMWNHSAEVNGNGTLFTVVFNKLSDSLNETSVKLSYDKDDTYNGKFGEVVLACSDITVSGMHQHKFGEWTAVTEATCVKEGTQIRTCATCGFTEEGTVPVDPNKHIGETEKRNAAEASCEGEGYTGDIYCLDCGACIEQGQPISPLGHSWGEWTIVTSPEEYTDGVEERICQVNSEHKEVRTIPHTHQHAIEKVEAKDPSCEEDGNTEYYICTGCNQIFKDAEGITGISVADTIIPAVGHEWGDWTVVKPAAEDEDGLEERICRHDETHIETRVIEAFTHDHVCEKTEGKAATCTEDGSAEYYVCSICGRKFRDAECTEEIPDSDIVIRAAGHIEGEPIRENETDLSYDEVHYCTVCGEELSRETHFKTVLLNMILPRETVSYTGKAITLSDSMIITGQSEDGREVILREGKEFKASYSNNKNAGAATVTVQGKGEYSGTLSKNFKIEPAVLKDAVLKYSSVEYTSKAITQTPDIVVKADVGGSEKKLKNDTDYVVSYENNTNAGTATVTISGRGNFSGSVIKKTFSITKARLASCSLPKSSLVYNQKERTQKITVLANVGGESKKLAEGTDYTVTYSNNKNPGTATVRIQGKGNYQGTLKKKFKILPKGTTVSKLTSKNGKLTVKWKKQSVQTSGYEIQYSMNKDFSSGNKKVTVKTNGKTSSAISGLKKGKTYYVRIRTYKTVGKNKYYSSWSGIKSKSIK